MALVEELKRRKVFKVAAAYLVVGWLLIQVASTVAPQLNLPEWAPRLVTFIILLGFPSAGAFQIANVYAFRKQPDDAFAWLDRALANRDSGIAEVYVYPFMFPLRSDPRFAAFCRKIGLPVPGEATSAASKFAAVNSLSTGAPNLEHKP